MTRETKPVKSKPPGKPVPPAKNLIANHGRWYLGTRIEGKKKWLPLTRIEEGDDAALTALLALRRTPAEKNLPARIREYQKTGLLGLTPNVQKEHIRILGHLSKSLSDFNTEDVEPQHVFKMLLPYADRPTMQRAYKARLSTFFRWCCGPMGYAKTNPCGEVWLKAPPKRDIHVDAESFWKIHAAMTDGKADITVKGTKRKKPDTGLMAQCLLEAYYLVVQRDTDLRLLRQDQVRDGFIHLRPAKTAKSSGAKVRVAITPALQGLLDRAAAIRRTYLAPSIHYIFPTPEGAPYSARRFLGIWNRALERCGMEDCGMVPKDILPTVMNDAADGQGYTILELQKARGHTSVTTTEHYMKQRVEIESPIRMNLPKRKA